MSYMEARVPVPPSNAGRVPKLHLEAVSGGKGMAGGHRPANRVPGIQTSRDGADSQRDAKKLKKDTLNLPQLAGGLTTAREIKEPLSNFPKKLMSQEPPALLTKMEKFLKDSGLFNSEELSSEATQSSLESPSPGRLDVLRVAFAMYLDKSTMFRPILTLVQREYEAHVRLAYDAQDRADSLHQDLATGFDSRAAELVEQKGKWKNRLKKAHEAVMESKGHYDQLHDHYQEQSESLKKVKEHCDKLKAKVKQLEEENKMLAEENVKSDWKIKAHEFDMMKVDRIESENMIKGEQNTVLINQVANMKTQLEMQELKYQNMAKEHGVFSKETRKLRSQMAIYNALRETSSPRPDWRRISADVPEPKILVVPTKSVLVAERIALDYQHERKRKYTYIFQDFSVLTYVATVDHAKQEEDAANSPLKDGDHLSPREDRLAPLNSSVPPSPEVHAKPSPGSVGKLARRGTMAKMKLAPPPKPVEEKKIVQKIKGAKPVAEYRTCPALGLGNSIPSFLKCTASVTVTDLPDQEIMNLVHRYWTARQDGIRFQAANSWDSAMSTFWRVVRNDNSSDEQCHQYAYSAMFGLDRIAKQSTEVNLMYHCILEEVDENTWHLHEEFKLMVDEFSGDIQEFLSMLLKKHPWIVNIQDQLTHIYKNKMPKGQRNLLNVTLPQKQAMLEYILSFHVVTRRRLFQRMRNGLLRSSLQALADPDRPVSVVQELCEKMAREIDPETSSAEIQILVNFGLINPKQEAERAGQLKQLDGGLRSRSVSPESGGPKKYIPVDPHDRVEHIMQNFLRYTTEANSIPVNRVLNKLASKV